MQQRVKFTLSNYTNFLPTQTPRHTGKKDHFIVDEERYPQYLRMGLNESYDETNSERIPVKSIPTDSKETDVYEIRGVLDSKFIIPDHYVRDVMNLNPKVKKELQFDPFAGIFIELHVAVKSDEYPTVMPRHSKVMVGYMDQISIQKTFYIKITNQRGNVLSQVQVNIKSIDYSTNESYDPKKKIESESNAMRSVREWIQEEGAKITKEFFRKASNRSYRFKKWGEGMRRFDLFVEPSFMGGRSINSFIYFRISKSNEAFWKRILSFVLSCKKTEYGVDLSVDDEEFFSSLSEHEKGAVLVEVCCSISVNMTYHSDYILTPEGMLLDTDDYSNVCEGSGDCDDLALFILYLFETFRKLGYDLHSMNHEESKLNGGHFKSKALESLWELSKKYQCCLSITTLGQPSSKTKSICNHVSTQFLHKKLLIDLVDLRQVDSQTAQNVLLVREYEEKMGNLETSKIVSRKSGEREQYPMVLFGEGTGMIYPYQTDVYFPKEYEKNRQNLSKCPIEFRNLRGKMFQSKKFQFHVRYTLLITNFFITHPIKTNLPTFYFSYRPKDNLDPDYESEMKGVDSGDLFAYNNTEKLEKMKDRVVLIPQVTFDDLYHAEHIIRVISRDKLAFTPLVAFSDNLDDKIVGNQNGVEGRSTIQTKSTSSLNSISYFELISDSKRLSTITPNIDPQRYLELKLVDNIPKKFDNYSYVLNTSGDFPLLLQTSEINRIVGHRFVILTLEATFFMIWYK